jgi:hypothetical protein
VSLIAEAKSTTLTDVQPRGDLAVLSAALMASEARKNRALSRAILNYRVCREALKAQILRKL